MVELRIQQGKTDGRCDGPFAVETNIGQAEGGKGFATEFRCVGNGGGAANGFEGKGADADIQTTFTFAAFE